MATLGTSSPAWAGDRGDPDPAVRELLASASDHEGYLTAIAALCTARFLLAVITIGDDGGGDGPNPNRHAELQAAILERADGRRALPAFTGVDALSAWRPDARPVPCRLDELAVAAVEQEAEAVLIDLVGPHPLVIEGDLLAELARGRRLVRLEDGGWAWLFADSSESLPPTAGGDADNPAAGDADSAPEGSAR